MQDKEADILAQIKDKIEKGVHDFQMVLNPCGYCERYKNMYGKDHETCTHCSYFYPSQFKYNPKNNE